MKNSTIITMAILFWMSLNVNLATAQVNADSIVVRSVTYLSPTARAVAVDVYGLLAPGLPANFTVDKGICPSYNNLGVTINNAITVTGNSSYTITVNGLPADSCIMLRAKIGGGNASAFSKYFSFTNSGCTFALSNSANMTVCPGTGTVLNASGGVSYNWSPSTGLDHSNIANPTATPASTTNYVVHATDASGCTSTGTVTVTVLTVSATITTTGATFCKGGNGMLTASGVAGPYVWSPAAGLNNPNISNPVASPSITTTYTVTGGNSGGCPVKAIAVANVNVNNASVSVTSSKDTACINVPGNIVLTGLPIGGVWVGTGVISGNLFSPVNAGLGNFTLNYALTDANGCVKNTSLQEQVVGASNVDSLKVSGNNYIFYGTFTSGVTLNINNVTYHPVTPNTYTQAIFNISSGVVHTGDLLIVESGGCAAMWTFGTGVNEVLKSEDVKVGPNPFTSILNVSLPQGEYKVSLVNMVGQTVYTTSAKGNFDIARGDLKQGIYFIQILSGKSIITKKVVAE